MPNMPVPFGDDVSAVNLNDKQVAVLKTDMLVAKTDVPKEMTLFQAARKAISHEHQRLCLKRCPTNSGACCT